MSQHESTLEAHPCAELFPLIEGAEFDELVEDIRKNGLRTQILVDAEGRVLDGRNRLRACRAAGVEPRFETWNGEGSPVELVVSLNLRRRHLNESQRALVAARLKESLAAQARKRSGARTDLRANWHGGGFGTAAEKAARLMNVSPRSVNRAAKLLRQGDSPTVRLVESGKLAVSAAAGGKARRARPAPPVPQPGAGEAVLALWTTTAKLDQADSLLAEWGFVRRSTAARREGVLLTAARPHPL